MQGDKMSKYITESTTKRQIRSASILYININIFNPAAKY